MAKNWPCKDQSHDRCHGIILVGGPMRGIEGTKKCTCDCHKEVRNV